MIRIVIADDQALIRDGLRAMLELEDDMKVIGEAEDGLQAIRLVCELEPDVVLMDVRMPTLDGIGAARQILSQTATPRVLMLTTFDRKEYIYEAMKAGASGFLLKDMRRDQIMYAIRTAMIGDKLIAPTITRRLIEEFCQQPLAENSPPGLAELTSRELDVLRLIARGLSNAEIGEQLYVSETTVKTHVRHIFDKLGVRDRVQTVVLAYESGIVRVGLL